MTDNKHTIEGVEPKYYARIPNMAIDFLPYAELALYTYYKRIASDQGKCWQSTETVANNLSMSAKKLRATRKALQDKGLIVVEERTNADGKECASKVIKVVNIWTDNVNMYTPPGKNDLPPWQKRPTPLAKSTDEEKEYKKNNKEKEKDSSPKNGDGADGGSDDGLDVIYDHVMAQCAVCNAIKDTNKLRCGVHVCNDCRQWLLALEAQPKVANPQQVHPPEAINGLCEVPTGGYQRAAPQLPIGDDPDSDDMEEVPTPKAETPAVKEPSYHQRLFGAISAALPGDPATRTKADKGVIGEATKQLKEVNAPPEMMPMLYYWCTERYDNPGAMCMAKYWSAFTASPEYSAALAEIANPTPPPEDDDEDEEGKTYYEPTPEEQAEIDRLWKELLSK